MDTRLYTFPALRGRRLHLGVCGSVAAYKAVEVMRALQKVGVQVSVTLTESAGRFITPLTFRSLDAAAVYTAMFDDQDDASRFAHLEPGQFAHAMLVAPATATSMARFAAGMADEILAAQVLAFAGPVVLAPAMNPRMWGSRATQSNVARLEERGFAFVLPSSGLVACGDTGQGKLADVHDIVAAAAAALCPQDLSGKTVLVTLGPTREQWDGVRVWTNLSTGTMGACLAIAAYLRGANVIAVAGPGVPRLPGAVRRVQVASAREMFEAASTHWPDADYGIFTAAVADYRPAPFGDDKFKKHAAAEGLSIDFLPNADILATLAAKAGPGQKLLGFAAETRDLEQASKQKLHAKNAHIIAGNIVGRPDSGFAASTNAMFICDRQGREEHWPHCEKTDAAWRLLDWLLTL